MAIIPIPPPPFSPPKQRRTAFFNAVQSGKAARVGRMLADPGMQDWLRSGRDGSVDVLVLAIRAVDPVMAGVLIDHGARPVLETIAGLLVQEAKVSGGKRGQWVSLRERCLDLLPVDQCPPGKARRLFAHASGEDAVRALVGWGLTVDDSGQDGMVAAIVGRAIRGVPAAALLPFLRFSLDMGFRPGPEVADPGRSEAMFFRGSGTGFVELTDVLAREGFIGFRGLTHFLQPGRFAHARHLLEWAKAQGEKTGTPLLDHCWRQYGVEESSGRGMYALEWLITQCGIGLSRTPMEPEEFGALSDVLSIFAREGMLLDNPVSPVLSRPPDPIPSIRQWAASRHPDAMVLIEKALLSGAMPVSAARTSPSRRL